MVISDLSRRCRGASIFAPCKSLSVQNRQKLLVWRCRGTVSLPRTSCENTTSTILRCLGCFPGQRLDRSILALSPLGLRDYGRCLTNRLFCHTGIRCDQKQETLPAVGSQSDRSDEEFSFTGDRASPTHPQSWLKSLTEPLGDTQLWKHCFPQTLTSNLDSFYLFHVGLLASQEF